MARVIHDNIKKLLAEELLSGKLLNGVHITIRDEDELYGWMLKVTEEITAQHTERLPNSGLD